MSKGILYVILACALILWFPTFGPSDVVFFAIVAKLGVQTYLLYSAIILVIVYNIVEGKGLSGKFQTLKKEVVRLIK